MNSIRTALAVSFLLVAAACSSTPDAVSDIHGDVLGAWEVETIGGVPVLVARSPYLEFDDAGVVSGDASINGFRGNWSATDARLELSEIAATKMGGPQHLMDQERRFLEALDEAAAVRREGDALVLLSASGEELVRARLRQD